MCVGALMAIMTLCLPRACMCDKPLAIFTGYLQTTAGRSITNINLVNHH